MISLTSLPSDQNVAPKADAAKGDSPKASRQSDSSKLEHSPGKKHARGAAFLKVLDATKTPPAASNAPVIAQGDGPTVARPTLLGGRVGNASARQLLPRAEAPVDGGVMILGQPVPEKEIPSGKGQDGATKDESPVDPTLSDGHDAQPSTLFPALALLPLVMVSAVPAPVPVQEVESAPVPSTVADGSPSGSAKDAFHQTVPGPMMPDPSDSASAIAKAMPAATDETVFTPAPVPGEKTTGWMAEKSAVTKNKIQAGPDGGTEKNVKNNFLNTDDKWLKNTQKDGGTESAQDAPSMPAPFTGPLQKDFPVAVPPPVQSVSGPMPAGPVNGPTETSARTEVVISHAAEAVDAVHELVLLADDLRAQGRSSVEVRFHSGDNAKLDVQVSYRNGEVQTTFRTDSPALRDTLSREWQAQVGAVIAEGRTYRFADPVFITTASTPAQAGGSSLGGDTSRQSFEHQQHPAQSGAEALGRPTFLSPNKSAQVVDSSASRSAIITPVETTLRHLHAFA